MNRIILIGNGFDLAHDLKTRYNDFIDWIFNEEMKKFQKNFKSFESNILELKLRNISYTSVYNHRYFNSFLEFRHKLSFNEQYLAKGLDGYKKLVESCNKADITLVIKNKFLKEIIKPNQDKNWYDIEESYYELLLKYVRGDENFIDVKKEIRQLHRDFNEVKNLLEQYLSEIVQDKSDNFKTNPEVKKIIYSKIKLRELKSEFHQTQLNYLNSIFKKHLKNCEEPLYDPDNDLRDLREQHSILGEVNKFDYQYKINELLEDVEDYDEYPGAILLLNFNYTNTASNYISNNYKSHIKEIFIHGELNNTHNPIIFGYGDEVDESYSELENLNDNEYLENIKSIQYSNTDNYKRLLNYINSDQYQVFIFGHSCGLSDRTMLNTIFEHENCVSIKPYYYKPEKGNDKYSDTVMNISRHFNDKAKMRDLVVNKTFCEALPQIAEEKKN